jgi:hypothetical protein
MINQAGDYLEEQEEQLVDGSKIIIAKIRVNKSTKRKFAVCKVVLYIGGIELTYWTTRKCHCCL